MKAYGTAIDQPPLGFYIEALFFKIFGLSANTGTALVTFFGLASTVVMYLVAKELYGKSTGFLAAALFGLNPWQLVLSRSFLLDAQCLFFSILCLYVGILAIRKGSVNLALVTGVVLRPRDERVHEQADDDRRQRHEAGEDREQRAPAPEPLQRDQHPEGNARARRR